MENVKIINCYYNIKDHISKKVLKLIVISIFDINKLLITLNL